MLVEGVSPQTLSPPHPIRAKYLSSWPGRLSGLICSMNVRGEWLRVGAHHTLGKGESRGPAPPPLGCCRGTHRSVRRMGFVCSANQENYQLSTASTRRTRKSLQHSDNSGGCPGLLTCSLSVSLASCLSQAFSSAPNRRQRKLPSVCVHMHTHTRSHTHTYSFVTTACTGTMCRAVGCCHPLLEHKFPARCASFSTASLFQPSSPPPPL